MATLRVFYLNYFCYRLILENRKHHNQLMTAKQPIAKSILKQEHYIAFVDGNISETLKIHVVFQAVPGA